MYDVLNREASERGLYNTIHGFRCNVVGTFYKQNMQNE